MLLQSLLGYIRQGLPIHFCVLVVLVKAIQALKEYFRSYSRPRCIVSDRGACFTSKDFEDFLLDNNVAHVLIAAGSPQANGQVERVNRSIGPMLAKLVRSENGIYCNTVLEQVEYSLNNTVHRTVGEQPSVMLFGRGQSGRVIYHLREILDGTVTSQHDDLATIRERAAERQRNLQDYNDRYVNKRKKIPLTYEKGDYVMVRNFDSTAGISRKLILLRALTEYQRFFATFVTFLRMLMGFRFRVHLIGAFGQHPICAHGLEGRIGSDRQREIRGPHSVRMAEL
ncbi:hypothetical protein EVAR_70009_1 [Eumeta japonica]|uniref:Integrase catalytic domain-containing protein n=1 Tax=Eumeta variegata TaxID=151549 RepID=A0A4C1SRV9_EUMVA|nr:hypothetical protein EVAR_70009_1 [Eumeta japonica]